MKPLICLIEDDAIMGEALAERFDIEGYQCDWYKRGLEALPPLTNKRYNLVVSDIRLPDISGEKLYDEVRAARRAVPPFLFITGHGAIDQAVRLLKLGAADYLTKPLDIPVLMEKVRVLCAKSVSASEGQPRLGISSTMRQIESMLPRIAGNARTVLITGESGVGKEVVAHAIHEASSAGKTRPFVAVNCGAITETLLETELFGHEKGAFTGAAGARRGCFEQADGGTLFLDEVGDMPLSMQVGLLRAIQERSIVRVGGERAIPIDIRLICATHRDLKALVQAGKFREDLYYRIHVIQVDIPPLRERREDILWLADRFLAELSVDGPRRLDASAEQALLDHPWPGNIRELRHCLERACILSASPTLSVDTLCGNGSDTTARPPPRTLADHVAASERRHIVDVLTANNGRIAETATQLGISRKNLWEKMRKLGIQGTESGSGAP